MVIKRNRNAFGRLIKVEEYTGNGTSIPYALYATTNYGYDPRDLLTNVTDAAANPTTIFYDGFGRKTRMIDPDLGDWRYRYDVFGNVTAQIDARNRALNMYYDDLNRLKGTTKNSDVDPDTYQPPADPDYPGYSDEYYYDAGTNGLGHRTSMKNGNSTTT
jgi:YD repeat-containing protein